MLFVLGGGLAVADNIVLAQLFSSSVTSLSVCEAGIVFPLSVLPVSYFPVSWQHESHPGTTEHAPAQEPLFQVFPYQNKMEMGNFIKTQHIPIGLWEIESLQAHSLTHS